MTIDAQILSALRAAGDSPVSGSELSQRLAISRAAVWARIEELRSLGYDIEASPHEGCRLRNVPDVLHADDLLSRLGKTRVVGRDIRVFQETTSTNDVIEKLASDGVKEGVVVFAEAQSKGRGRLGRKWISPARKGIWFSVLLRPNLRPSEATRLNIAASTAVARAIRSETELHPQIKWPNDILMGGRKVAGILTELSAELDHVKHIALGIGVDANLTASDFPADLRKQATSIKLEAGRNVDRAALATAVLRELDVDYGRISSGQFEAVADEWEELCSTLGHNISIRVGDRLLQGRAESLDDDGALLLRTQHGRLERIVGGDVVVKK
ncbi:MAG: biotin--[acetyl-CoA-carboxylase] ligase [Verrucomicrobia bacterium]|nr:biotin--[acetyl-CoA-carboxylase] ligase [Verrucomicrobiota bacterium]